MEIPKRNIPEQTSQMYLLTRIAERNKLKIKKLEHGDKIIIEIYNSTSENPIIFATGSTEAEAAKLAIDSGRAQKLFIN